MDSTEHGPGGALRGPLWRAWVQTRDLVEAMRQTGRAPAPGRCCGSTAANDRQRLDHCSSSPTSLGARWTVPRSARPTALGAAWLAGMEAGLCHGMDGFARKLALERRFEPAMDESTRAGALRRPGRDAGGPHAHAATRSVDMLPRPDELSVKKQFFSNGFELCHSHALRKLDPAVSGGAGAGKGCARFRATLAAKGSHGRGRSGGIAVSAGERADPPPWGNGVLLSRSGSADESGPPRPCFSFCSAAQASAAPMRSNDLSRPCRTIPSAVRRFPMPSRKQQAAQRHVGKSLARGRPAHPSAAWRAADEPPPSPDVPPSIPAARRGKTVPVLGHARAHLGQFEILCAAATL